MQILGVFVMGCLLLLVISRIINFYDPDSKGLGIYYAFMLFLLFSMGILDLHSPVIGPDP